MYVHQHNDVCISVHETDDMDKCGPTETDTRECNCDICIKSGIGIRVHWEKKKKKYIYNKYVLRLV